MVASKKILCFIESLEAGGSQRQIIALASLLQRNGHHPVIVTYYPNDFYAETLDTLGIEHIFLNTSSSKLSRLRAFWKLLKKQSPDSVVSFTEASSMLLCIIRLFRHFRLIVSERNVTQEMVHSEWLRFQLFRFADKVVCNSTSQYKFIEKNMPFLTPKTVVINNYLDTEFFKPLQAKKVSSERSLLVLARVTPQKNLVRFIEALRMVRDDGFHLLVDWYGHHTEPYLSECLELVSKYKLGDILHIHPPVSHVEKLYNQYDGFCLPSIYEGFPNVVSEALSCGVPVLCGDVCDNTLIVGENTGNPIFNPFDVTDMKEKIEHFCTLDESQLQAIGKANRERALYLFSSDKHVNEYLQLM